jgi:hypothetical protein
MKSYKSCKKFRNLQTQYKYNRTDRFPNQAESHHAHPKRAVLHVLVMDLGHCDQRQWRGYAYACVRTHVCSDRYRVFSFGHWQSASHIHHTSHLPTHTSHTKKMRFTTVQVTSLVATLMFGYLWLWLVSILFASMSVFITDHNQANTRRKGADRIRVNSKRWPQ